MRRLVSFTAVLVLAVGTVICAAERVRAEENCQDLVKSDAPFDSGFVGERSPLWQFCNAVKAEARQGVRLMTPGQTGTIDSGAPTLTINLADSPVDATAISRLLSHGGEQERVAWPSMVVKNGVIRGEVKFRNQDVPRSVLFRNVAFRPNINVADCDFSDGALSFKSARALGQFRIQNGPEKQICGNIYISNSKFEGDFQVKGIKENQRTESGPLIITKLSFSGAVRAENLFFKRAKYEVTAHPRRCGSGM